jgi:hypothetical protein
VTVRCRTHHHRQAFPTHLEPRLGDDATFALEEIQRDGTFG